MFTWIPFYEELATKLLEYRNKQAELISFLKGLEDKGIKSQKMNDRDSKGRTVLLNEIDPFTFYSNFNRGIKEENRYAIMREIKNKFGLKSDIPTDLDGLPVVNNMKAWFFPFAGKRKNDDISVLWDLAAAVVQKEVDQIDENLFNRCLMIGNVGMAKLTMGMFWMRPDKFLSYDNKNYEYFESEGLRVEETDYASYKKFIHGVKDRLGSDFKKLSRQAWLYSKPSNENESSTVPTPNSLKTILNSNVFQDDLNVILYGPPGTGKTYQVVEMATRICDEKVGLDRNAIVKRFKELQETSRIKFITFHQSYSYEEFVEGIRPVLSKDESGNDGGAKYVLKDGVFKTICNSASTKTQLLTTNKNLLDDPNIRIWKMSLGRYNSLEEGGIYDDCKKQNELWLGYGGDIDFTGCDTREKVYKALKKDDSATQPLDYSVTSVDTFKNKIKTGDLIIVTEGNSKFRSIGKVTGNYLPPGDEKNYQHRSVEWLVHFEPSMPREKIMDKTFSQMTLYEIDKNYLKMDVLKSLLTKDTTKENNEKYVLIIDEINRGNISKIFGELITLIEPDKRIGSQNEIQAELPYSNSKFGVPANLYILGTMNTADRSIAFIDSALRRRFIFKEIKPDPSVIEKTVGEEGVIEEVEVDALLKCMNSRIEALYDRDHLVGHSYFLKVKTLNDLKSVFLKEIMPLLSEYFHHDRKKMAKVLGCENNNESETILKKISSGKNNDYDINETWETNESFEKATGAELVKYFNNLINAE